MKKIYILTAVFALLTLSLNAQTMAKKAVKQTAPSMKAPNRVAVEVASSDFSNASWWTIISDGQGNTWQVTSGYGYYNYSSSYAADDWLVTSPIALEAGKTYTFKLNARARSESFPEKLEVKMASANTTATAALLSAGTTVIGETTLTNTSYTTLEGTVTPSTSGNYYFGIHAMSDRDMFSLYVDDMVITTDVPYHDLGITLSAPATIVAGETATITATVTNNGDQTESGYTVTFSDGTTTFPTQTGGTLNPGDTETFTLNYPTSAAGTVTITANVACTGDAEQSNDEATTNLQVNAPLQDLGITLSAPASVVGGNSATVTATVTNTGNQPMTGYTVTITDGTNTLLTQTVNETLAPGASETFDATYATTEAQVGTTVNFTATVACTGDADATNNSATASTEVITLPPPVNVQATPNSQNQSATVTWEIPSNLPSETTTVTDYVTEGFDDTSVFVPYSVGGISATQHTGAIGDWTLYDPSGANVFSDQNLDWENEGAPHAWQVFPASTFDMEAHSGDQIMLSINCVTSGGNTNHWLISPELSGNAQTISFYAAEITTSYGAETYEIWVSTTDNDPASFSQLGSSSYSVTTATWDAQTVSLPAGTKYFAIRNTSYDIYGMMVDDVRYETTRTETVTLSPESYNVYLDGVLVDNVNANDPLTYTFNNVTAGVEHTVEISAVYPGNIESAKESDTFYIQPKTDPPTFSVTTGETAYTITAIAPQSDPNATVTMTVDGQEYTGTGSVSVTVERGTTDQSVYVSATAQASGKLVSDPNAQYVNVPMLPITQTPTITYTQTNGTVVVTANGEGTITLTTSDGQTVTGEGPLSITIVRSLEDRTITATASAVAPNHQPSGTATETVPVPALSGTPIEPEEGLLRMHLLVVDQFKEDIPADNSHPDRYGYVLKWEQPANAADHKKSGTVDVEIKKTEAQVNGYYTKTQVDNDIDYENSELTMDVLTADVGMFLPGEDPTVLYYEMQAKKDDNPADPGLGLDFVTQLQYMKNVQKYEEMLATSPNKTHQYPAEETYHYFDESTPIVTGTYGVNFMTYAPSVSTWGIQRRYFEIDDQDNTYGAPIWKTSVGRVRMIHSEAQLQRGPQGSTQWDGVGGPCSLVFLGVEAFGDLPSTDITNIVYEPYMFRVWIESPGNNLRGCNLIPKDQDPDKPGEHWDGDGTCYGADPVLIYEETTTDGHLYKSVQEPSEGNNEPWGEKIQFGALDSGLSDLIVYVRYYYRSTGEGISEEGSKFMLRGNRDGEGEETPEVPGYYATEDDGNPDITTGINEMWYDFNGGEVVSTTYVNSLGMQSDQPFEGVNIVITRYSDGKVRTTKLVR